MESKTEKEENDKPICDQPVIEKEKENIAIQSKSESQEPIQPPQNDTVNTQKSDQSNIENDNERYDSKEIEDELDTEIIRLNVGGVNFATTKSTLTKSKYFKVLLSNSFGDQLKDGSYFIDRNPKYFEYLLDYLRCGYVSIPSVYANVIHLEAQFFQIEMDLTEIIKKIQSPNLTLRYYHRLNLKKSITINGENLTQIHNNYKISADMIKHVSEDMRGNFMAIALHMEKECGYEISQIALNSMDHNNLYQEKIIYMKPKIPKITMIMLK